MSFVFVPRIPLKTNMITRLKTKGLLEVADVAELWRNRLNVEEDALSADVYVGAFHDMGTAFCKRLINNWYGTSKKTILGLVVIDEFQNFETEFSIRPGSYESIGRIKLQLAWKVLVLSSTLGCQGFATALERLGFEMPLTTEPSLGEQCYVHDLVHELPLANSIKWFGGVFCLRRAWRGLKYW
ncbi:uncharacterized protein KNAG_0C00130 [Huiozyma naganishii CBS 8797]|uniref:Helicase ATP-binding domain-containing protein n=1 Tax=Huiozyma naganishii (strain ATCC MYA-139 / BCRC 22969 / CBS 8797 / KCTC 17520 / NBRC 10181 / NCYC 3082 / Yp74L-3) TaxID=1071383 RepID=J7RHV6_HUIN7|nr:hypothetical protein KNAG_0C00130 [Kazachstania naganishii CBS 8797]CCK69128.1 hypothetical protein KNAG_0C00130 [Kazachstania naganishii CBS 8797]